jgi:hypothetical protein
MSYALGVFCLTWFWSDDVRALQGYSSSHEDFAIVDSSGAIQIKNSLETSLLAPSDDELDVTVDSSGDIKIKKLSGHSLGNNSSDTVFASGEIAHNKSFLRQSPSVSAGREKPISELRVTMRNDTSHSDSSLASGNVTISLGRRNETVIPSQNVLSSRKRFNRHNVLQRLNATLDKTASQSLLSARNRRIAHRWPSFLKKIFHNAKSAVTNVVDKVKSVANKIQHTVHKHISHVKTGIANAHHHVKAKAKEIVGTIKTIAKETAKKCIDVAKKHGPALLGGAVALATTGNPGPLLGTIKSAFTDVKEQTLEGVQNVKEEIKAGAQDFKETGGSILRAQATALEHTISEVKAHIEEGRISLDGGMDQIFANVIQDDVAAQDMLMAKMGKIVGGKEEIAEIQGDAIAIETQMEEDAVAKAIAQTNGGFFLQQKRTEPRFEASAIAHTYHEIRPEPKRSASEPNRSAFS